MVYTSGRFMFSLVYFFVLIFFSPFSIVITSLGKERAGPCASCAFVYFTRVNHCPFFSSSWCQGLAATCGCGTPRTFLISFVHTIQVSPKLKLGLEFIKCLY